MSNNSQSYQIEPTDKKKAVVLETTEKLNKAVGAFLLDYRGLSVSEVSDLRRKLGEADAEFHVIKNTLLRIAAEPTSHDFGDMLEGPTAIALLFGDPVAPAKVFAEYLETHREVALKGGVLEGKPLTADQINALSKIPPKDVLIAQFVWAMAGPLSGLVGTLAGVLSNFVYTLQAISDQKGGGAEAEAA